MTREQAIECMAVALWVDDAARAAPNVAKYRNAETFWNESPATRNRWQLAAKAALDAYHAYLTASGMAIVPVEWLREKGGGGEMGYLWGLAVDEIVAAQGEAR